RIPPRLGYFLAERAATVICHYSASRRHVEDNTAHVVGLPPRSPEVKRITLQIFRNQAKNYFDLLRVDRLSSQDIRRAVREVRGLAHLDRALARGHGVVLASAHFGNIDFAGQILAVLGYRVTALAEHLKPERLFQYVRRQRESHGLSFVPIDQLLRPAFRALRANEIVGSALDRNVTDAGRLVEFLGCPARLPDGYVRLALHTQAALVLCFCRRLEDNTFVITVEPEIELDRAADRERAIVAGMAKATAIFAAYLKRYPDQWVYFQPVWE
ncbi:MAG TPA: lysophospholipid acyltransferase family protein, partial [Anaerolineae bacterium]|nr:lysophospholipid acyltransferase family protein [Anaerolineae bacterium]